AVQIRRGDRYVAIAGADLVRVDAVVVCQLQPGLRAVVGQTHEHVDRLVANRDPADLVEPERVVEGDRSIDVGDPVAGMDERHVLTLPLVIIERSMNESFVSNTYLVADEL